MFGKDPIIKEADHLNVIVKDINKFREAATFINNIKLNFKQYFVLLFQDDIVNNFMNNRVTGNKLGRRGLNILLKKFSYVSNDKLIK